MKRSYRYKLKPTVKQQKMLLQFFGCARFIYNWGLARKITAYNETKKNINYVQLAREMTQLKQTDDHQWLNDCANEVLQQSLRTLETAYTNHFKNKKGFPKFKGKKRSKEACKFVNRIQFDFVKNKVKVAKLGWMKICPNEMFDFNKCKIGTLTVSRDKCGDYWCSAVVDDGEESKSKAKICEDTAVGIHICQNYVMLSDGSKYESPNSLVKREQRLKRLQQKFARTEMESKRHAVKRMKFARLNRKVVNSKADCLHKLTSDLVGRFDTICIERQNVNDVMKNLQQVKMLASVSWGEFVRQLTYKCERGGKNLVWVERKEATRDIPDEGVLAAAMQIKQLGLQQQVATG